MHLCSQPARPRTLLPSAGRRVGFPRRPQHPTYSNATPPRILNGAPTRLEPRCCRQRSRGPPSRLPKSAAPRGGSCGVLGPLGVWPVARAHPHPWREGGGGPARQSVPGSRCACRRRRRRRRRHPSAAPPPTRPPPLRVSYLPHLHAAVSLVPPRTCRGILLRESCPSPASLACRPWGPACRRRWADPFFFFAGGFFLLCPLLRRSTAVEQLPAALCTVGDSVRVVLLVPSALWCVSGLELPHAWRAACPPHASRLLWCPGFFSGPVIITI